jgi:hypothetical protein
MLAYEPRVQVKYLAGLEGRAKIAGMQYEVFLIVNHNRRQICCDPQLMQKKKIGVMKYIFSAGCRAMAVRLIPSQPLPRKFFRQGR